MSDQELRAARFKVSIAREGGGSLDETIISSGGVGVCCCTGVIECGKDARWAFLLDEVANNLVIEEFDGRPLDLFANIFLLFCLERELNEDLLEFLVHVVDAELFE